MMLRDPADDVEDDDEEEADCFAAPPPVMTWSPDCRPETTCVVTPSVMPVWIGTRTGAPFCSTYTAG